MSPKKFISRCIQFNLILIFLLVIFQSSITNNLAENNLITQNDPSLEDEVLSSDIIAYYRSSQANLTIDGIVNDTEYLDSRLDATTGIKIYLEHNNTHLFIGLVAPTLGWLAVGFNSQGKGMKGANLILANVVNDTSSITDRYGIGNTAPLQDTSSNGTNDIVEFKGSETNGTTSFEFFMPLDSGDEHDYPLIINQSSDIFFAYSDSDDFSKQHKVHSELNIKLFIAPDFLKVPKNTKIFNITPDSMSFSNNENFTLTAMLVDSETDLPLANSSINFYLVGSFGNLLLGNAMTNQNGEANLTTMLTDYHLNDIAFLLMFRGSLFYRVSSVDASFNFNIVENKQNSLDWVPIFVGLSGVFVISIPWMGYSYAFYLFIHVIRNKSEEQDIQESQ